MYCHLYIFTRVNRAPLLMIERCLLGRETATASETTCGAASGTWQYAIRRTGDAFETYVRKVCQLNHIIIIIVIIIIIIIALKSLEIKFSGSSLQKSWGISTLITIPIVNRRLDSAGKVIKKILFKWERNLALFSVSLRTGWYSKE